MTRYFVEYSNDVGPCDDHFYEFWKVKDRGEHCQFSEYKARTICTCDDELDAIEIRDALMKIKGSKLVGD